VGPWPWPEGNVRTNAFRRCGEGDPRKPADRQTPLPRRFGVEGDAGAAKQTVERSCPEKTPILDASAQRKGRFEGRVRRNAEPGAPGPGDLPGSYCQPVIPRPAVLRRRGKRLTRPVVARRPTPEGNAGIEACAALGRARPQRHTPRSVPEGLREFRCARVETNAHLTARCSRRKRDLKRPAPR
jgi:hypothetical protein